MAFMKVAVNDVEDGRIAGAVYSRRLKEPIRFRDAADMLLQIERLLDQQDFPRAFQKKRSFVKSTKKDKGNTFGKKDEEDDEGYMDEETVEQAEGEVSTFVMNVITRQNTSWQGYLDWLDGSPKIAYNSVLELLSLITRKLQG